MYLLVVHRLQQWHGHVNALLLRLNPKPPDDLIASTICGEASLYYIHIKSNVHLDSILSLFNSYHADSTLKEYLRIAVSDPTIPVQLWTLVPSFLRSVRSTTIHDASTMRMVCRLILNLYYETQGPPLGSLISFSELPNDLLHIISDALYLLRLSYEFPDSPFHNLTTTVSELFVHLLSCVGDMSEVSATQATVLLSVVHDVLQVVALQDNVRQALDSFLLSLSLLLGDGTKQAEEAEMFASFQLTPGKLETGGPNPSLDLLTGSLIMSRLVCSCREGPCHTLTESYFLAGLYSCCSKWVRMRAGRSGKSRRLVPRFDANAWGFLRTCCLVRAGLSISNTTRSKPDPYICMEKFYSWTGTLPGTTRISLTLTCSDAIPSTQISRQDRCRSRDRCRPCACNFFQRLTFKPTVIWLVRYVCHANSNRPSIQSP